MVSADPDFDLPAFLEPDSIGDFERDPAEVDPSRANPFRAVTDSSYNHQNLFGATGPIPILSEAKTEPISVVSDDDTAPIATIPEDAEKPANNSELF